MADPLASLLRSHGGPILPALERLAPPPSEGLIGAEIEARSNPGDVVIELHGRGGWIARGAIERLRRAVAIESTALTRLVAELVLRPPDLRHLDAALNTLANQPRGSAGLRDSINAGFASRCATCGGPVLVDEFIWDGDAGVPARRSYRCGHCRDQRGNEGRSVPVDRDDVARAQALDASLPRSVLLLRFPIPERDHPLPGQIMDLYPPRALDAIAAIVERIESDLRAPGIQAALRLAVVHMLLPASRLNSYPGRVAQLRIAAGKIRPPGSRQWRERNPWLLFEEGFRSVRSFVQRMEGAVGSRAHARLGSDLEALLDGSANVVLRQGSASDLMRAPGPVRFSPRPEEPDPRTRVRLVLTQPPIHWTAESLGFAYLATSIAIGNEAALTLPLDALFRVQPRGEWAWDAAALRRALGNVRGVLAPDARVVLLLDRSVPGALVAGVLGGVGAGYRLLDAVLAETGDEITGTLEFGSPEDAAPADRAAAATATATATATAPAGGPLQLKAVSAAVGDIAVAVLQARGEPARYERLLGEVLIGLDRAGHLGRIVGTPAADAVARTADSRVVSSDLPGGMVAAAVVPGSTRSGDSQIVAETGAAAAGAGAAAGDAAVSAAGPAHGVGQDPAGHAPAGDDAPTAVPTPASAITEPPAGPLPPGRSWRDPERPVRAPSLGLEARLGTWADGPGAEPFSGVLSPEPGSSALDASPPAVGHDAPSAMVMSTSQPAASAAASPAAMTAGQTQAGPPAAVHLEGSVAGSEAVASWGADGTTADPVRLVLEIVTGELRRTDHPRLLELEPGRWWLREARDVEAARPPLSDRLEWAVFSLLSTAGGISEAAFFRRIARMFRGHDTPDAEMVRACLESYQAPHPEAEGTFHTEDALPARFEEHGATVGLLTELGHRLGLRCWISKREQRRPFREGTLADLLSDVEERVYLPLVCPGPADALEAVDCIWYLRGKATFLFEVEWTAMLSEPVLRRGARIPTNDQLVRFLVIPPERTALVRLKLARSPLLREQFEEGNWHILKTDHVRRLVGREDVSLDDLAPLLGLDPEIERRGEQLSFFG